MEKTELDFSRLPSLMASSAPGLLLPVSIRSPQTTFQKDFWLTLLSENSINQVLGTIICVSHAPKILGVVAYLSFHRRGKDTSSQTPPKPCRIYGQNYEGVSQVLILHDMNFCQSAKMVRLFRHTCQNTSSNIMLHADIMAAKKKIKVYALSITVESSSALLSEHLHGARLHRLGLEKTSE